MRRLLCPALLVAALVTAPVPASAQSGAPESACTADQVEVVVDFADLGGGAQSRCVDGGGVASDLLEDAGFDLTPVQGSPDFLCRVAGEPASDPCTEPPAASGYWGMWVADDADAEWGYAQQGVFLQRMEPGSRLGLAWQSGTERLPSDDTTPAAEAGDGSDAPVSTADADDSEETDEPEGVPAWVVVTMLVLLAIGAAALAVSRRRNRP